jgi:proline iminopeptidase
VADYQDLNADFFDAQKFFVVEVDQRGTGRSLPSVREPLPKATENMKLYMNISLEVMSKDYEEVRKHLKIDKWLVFGGSWGSTLALDYATRYPEQCLGLIVRGIYLSTAPEMDMVYMRKPFEPTGSESTEELALKQRQLREFDIFLEEIQKDGSTDATLAYNAEAILRKYEERILQGDRTAIWKFYVFENNLMAESEDELLDPYNSDNPTFLEATSVSFFEARLFLKGCYEDPVDLIGKLQRLREMSGPTWVVQGLGDAVCPEAFARVLVKGLDDAGVPNRALFVDAGHKASTRGVKGALQDSIEEFLEQHQDSRA